VIIKDGHVMSMSAWESNANAQAAHVAAKEWVSEAATGLTVAARHAGAGNAEQGIKARACETGERKVLIL